MQQSIVRGEGKPLNHRRLGRNCANSKNESIFFTAKLLLLVNTSDVGVAGDVKVEEVFISNSG